MMRTTRLQPCSLPAHKIRGMSAVEILFSDMMVAVSTFSLGLLELNVISSATAVGLGKEEECAHLACAVGEFNHCTLADCGPRNIRPRLPHTKQNSAIANPL
eukprot:5663877-Amphidinium_carterae.3